MTKKITDANFEKEVLDSDVPVIVDFWAPWCGPCQVMSPVIDEVAEEFSGKIKVYKMNVDENAHVPTQYGVRSIPHIALFKKGNVIENITGAVAKHKIEKMISDNI